MIAPVVAGRPRTLVVTIESRELAATVVARTGEPMTSWARAELAAEAPRGDVLDALWGLVESLGEFDRISAGCARRGDEWARDALADELARQSLRPARVVGGAVELLAPSVIARRGVELVLALGTSFGSALFIDGAAAPGFELGRHRFRKGMTYAEYLAGEAAERLGRRKWNKRALRAFDEVIAVFAPARLYVVGANAALVHGELPACVEVVAQAHGLAGAVALWA